MELDAFLLKYYKLKSRIAPFRLKQDFETQKTVEVITRLLDRAETVHSGADVNGRYGVTAGHNIENYMERAERYILALERGEYPLKGMFAEPGRALIDHSFVEKDGKLHVFYICATIGYEWDTRQTDFLGHAVTEDLINWQICPPCITVEPDGPDEHQVWAPGVAKKGDTYYMYYTGVNINIAQSICLATSKDLYHWEKFENNPVVLPGDWGEWSEDKWSDCRDAMVLVEEDTAYMYYCTAKKHSDGTLHAALGVASSDDMYKWKDEGAYEFDICDFALESPFVLRHNDKYYLFYTNCGHGTSYAVSDNAIDGWKSLGMLIEKNGVPLCPANVPSCAEVFEFKGKWYISCCERQPGCEQYLEIFEFIWNDDGTASVGKRIE